MMIFSYKVTYAASRGDLRMQQCLFVTVLFLIPHFTIASNIKVEGLVHQKINVTLNLDDVQFGNDAYLTCEPSVPYITFFSENFESQKRLGGDLLN